MIGIIRFILWFRKGNWEQGIFKISMVFSCNSIKQLKNKMYNCHYSIKIIT